MSPLYKQCETCGEWYFAAIFADESEMKHDCGDKWECIIDNPLWNNETYSTYAHDPAEAAEKAYEQFMEYIDDFCGHEELEFKVRKVGDEDFIRVSVLAEYVIEYTGRLINE